MDLFFWPEKNAYPKLVFPLLPEVGLRFRNFYFAILFSGLVELMHKNPDSIELLELGVKPV